MAECSGSVVSNNVNTQKQSSVVQSTDSVGEDKTDKVMEPLLLEDFKYKEEPKTFLHLLEFFERRQVTPNKNDILVGLVYILMLESGFVPVEYKDSFEDFSFNYQRILNFSKQLPRNWKIGSVYSYSLVLPPFALYECKVACIVMADDLLVNCVVKGMDDGNFNIILDPLTYFTSSNTDIPSGKLQNLRSLSRLVKSEVCYPLKQRILGQMKIEIDNFQSLPFEIILLIMSYLKIEDLIHLGQVNFCFYSLMRTPKLWINRLKIDFKHDYKKQLPLYTYEQLRTFYKMNYATSKRVNKNMSGW